MADPYHITENPPETLTDADIERLMRKYRNRLLADCDWTQLVDAVVPDQAAWAAYRQQLRDAPESWTVGQPWTPPDPPA